MAKTIKFNLICDNTPVRTIEDLQNNFSIEDVLNYYRKHPDTRLGHWYFLGSGVAMYTNWQCWTLIGLAFGAVFPRLQNLGLDFAMVVTFIAIVVPQLIRVPQLAAAVAAGCVAYALKDAPYKLGLMAAVGMGVLVGLLTTRLRREAVSNRTTT